jgi:hypothetical protein
MLTLDPATMHAEAPHSKTKLLLAIHEIIRACGHTAPDRLTALPIRPISGSFLSY